MKHTKGNWKVDNTSIRSDGELVAISTTLIDRVDEERLNNESWLSMRERTKPERKACEDERNANAKLIAAAPELLEALKEIANTHHNGEYGDAFAIIVQTAAEAIQKAES